jgi:hypothetical protein
MVVSPAAAHRVAVERAQPRHRLAGVADPAASPPPRRRRPASASPPRTSAATDSARPLARQQRPRVPRTVISTVPGAATSRRAATPRPRSPGRPDETPPAPPPRPRTPAAPWRPAAPATRVRRHGHPTRHVAAGQVLGQGRGDDAVDRPDLGDCQGALHRSISHPRTRARCRRRGSGLTTRGCPTRSSIGRSLKLSV